MGREAEEDVHRGPPLEMRTPMLQRRSLRSSARTSPDASRGRTGEFAGYQDDRGRPVGRGHLAASSADIIKTAER